MSAAAAAVHLDFLYSSLFALSLSLLLPLRYSQPTSECKLQLPLCSPRDGLWRLSWGGGGELSISKLNVPGASIHIQNATPTLEDERASERAREGRKCARLATSKNEVESLHSFYFMAIFIKWVAPCARDKLYYILLLMLPL